VALTSASTIIAGRTELTPEELRAVVAVAGHTVLWQTGPSLPWLSSRMGWPETQSRTELEQLQRSGLIVANGTDDLLAREEAVTAALATWRDQHARRNATRPGIHVARMRGSVERPTSAASN
jgi:hypothetical protein